MKRLDILHVITIVFLFTISVAISAQENNRHRHESRRGGHESRISRSERHQEGVRKLDKHTYSPQSDYRQRDVRRRHNKCEAHKYTQKYNQKGKHHHYPVYKHRDMRDVRCLPSRHYTRMYFGNETYYYCDGQFYTYHKDCGYHLVTIRFQSVSHLPRHCEVRVMDGRRFYYKDGYCYLPHAKGHYRVFNISVMM